LNPGTLYRPLIAREAVFPYYRYTNTINTFLFDMNILFLGDSLIEYFDWQRRFADHRVMNCGMAGESVQGLLSRVAKIKGVCPEADLIFVMSGINNVAMGDIDFLDFYRAILERLGLAYPGARIFVNSLLPVGTDFIENESILNINNTLKELSGDTGVDFLDVHKLFIDERGEPVMDYLLYDGVHVSEKGYNVWSEALEKIIN
jgi:lysophospholipase L1-like esterase